MHRDLAFQPSRSARPRLMDESIPAMVWTAQPDMSCDYLSGEWLRFTGLSPAQALGDGWSRGVHPEDLARWLDTCVRAFDAQEPFCMEYRLRRHDGEYRWVLDRAVPRHAEDGAFTGYVGTCVDIEERKRCEHELARALERERKLRLAVEESSRLKDAFLGTVLQYLRSPILSGTRVLVVDDDPGAREAIVKVLGIAGADVKAAAGTEEALETLQGFRADVVLCGLGMARDGYALIRALRSVPVGQGGGLRAAALTAAGRPEDGLRAIAAGYDAQLAKPVEPVTLLATVSRLSAHG